MTEKRCLVEVKYTICQALWVNAVTPKDAEYQAEEKVANLIKRLPVWTTGFKGRVVKVEGLEIESEKGE